MVLVGAVFLLAVPFMVVILVLGPKLLPEYRNERKGGLDLLSSALAISAILLIVFALKEATREGLAWPVVIAGAVGFGIGTVFMFRQKHLEEPLLDLDLFRYQGFSAALVSLTLAIFSIGGLMFLVYQYLQWVIGLSPLEAGLWLLPSTLAGPFVSFAVPTFAQRVAPNRLISLCLALGAASLATLVLIGSLHELAVIVVGMTLLSAGLAPVTILGTDLIISAAPAEQAGVASATSETGTELGMALGVAVFGSLAAMIYSSGLEKAVSEEVPIELSTRASETLGAAIAIAQSVETNLASELVEVARQSFAYAFQVSAVIAAAILGVTCVVALRFLPSECRAETEQVDASGSNPDT